MRFLHKKRARTPAVIIVSLIDVLLVVLIFLMVTTTAKKIEPALRLNLPDSKEAKPGPPGKDKPFTILVASNFPFFFIGDKATTFDKLQAELTDAVKKDPNLKVSVRADKLAPFGEIVKLIDATKAAQVGSLNFITEKQARP